MLLVLRELREDLVSTFALTQGAKHRRGRGKERDDEGHDEDDRREDHARDRESDQDRGDDGWRQEERDEHPGDWDERLPRRGLHGKDLLVGERLRGRHHGLRASRESISNDRHRLEIPLRLRAERANRTRRETNQEVLARVRVQADSRMDERPRRRRKRREERTSDFVAARKDVADLGPRIVTTRAADPLPQRKRDLDPVLEHEGRARLENDYRGDDERD